MKVGIFDSGMGGLSVLYDARRAMPEAEFVYYADEEHVPYGEKSREQVREYIGEIIGFLLQKEVDAIVIACNTATSVATKEYRETFPVPIVGMEPAVKLAVDRYGGERGRILVSATPLTIAGAKLHHLLEQVDTHDDVDLVALPGLVRFAERGDFETEEITAYLREALKDFDLRKYGAFVLGCTHFLYFMEHYRKIFPENTRFINGNDGTVRQLMRKLAGSGAGPSEHPGRVEYYFSGHPVTEKDMERIERYLEQLRKVSGL